MATARTHPAARGRSGTLQFLGAAGNVTGACFLLRSGSRQLLVDCGLIQEARLVGRNRDPFLFEPREIDGVLLTHAHLDHSGRLPRLVHQGFRGPIWSTPATKDIARIVLMDAARLNQEDATYARRRARKRGGHRPPHTVPPLYGIGDVRATMPQFSTIDYHQRISVGPDLYATFSDAGHILGAASIRVELPARNGAASVLFSGDLGRPNRMILHDPDPPPAADFVVIESTYGDRLHDRTDPEDKFAAVINDAVSRGGNIVIPSFAVERTQEVLLLLRRLTEARRIPPLLTFLDSPMGTAVTRLFRRYPALLDPDVSAEFGRRRSPFEFASLQVTETPEASKAINEVRGSVIIIAGAGMCNGGRVLHHLVHNIGRAESTVLIVGYQAPGTLGRAIVEGEPVVHLFGEPHEVRARIAEVPSLSAHADRDEITDWLLQLPERPKRVFVVHGETHAAQSLRDHLATRTGWDVVIPAYGDVFDLAV